MLKPETISDKKLGQIDSLESARRILRSLSPKESFLFFTNVGQYNGVHASSLANFYRKLDSVSSNSIEFHFRRGDFGRWISETLTDTPLADRIGKIDKSLHGKYLTEAIQQIVKRRLQELRNIITKQRHATNK